MSADNWAICPKCLNNERTRIEDLLRQVREGYGVLDLDGFEALRSEASEPIDEEAFRTFREDYEIYGAEDGAITVSYSGNCSKCGLRNIFKHTETFWPS